MSSKTKSASQGGGKRSLFSILMFIVAISAFVLSVCMFWELKFNKQAPAGAAEAEEQPVVAVEPLYLSMNTFTVSLSPTADESERVLFLGVSVRLADRESLITLEKYLPEYRSRIFMLLTKQTYNALSTDDGKNKLIVNLRNELAKPLPLNQTIKPSEVLINEFILR